MLRAISVTSAKRLAFRRPRRGTYRAPLHPVMSSLSQTDPLVTEPRSHRAERAARIARVVDYGFSVLYVLFFVRLVLEFLRARRESGFYELIAGVTDPFYAPFKYIVATHTLDGAPIVWPLVVAILGYMLLHALVRGILRLVARG